MRIAVVGTGIAGNAAAWALSVGSSHDVTVYEQSGMAGGHCRTVTFDYDGARIAVDTGFMIFNELNYPRLTALFRTLGAATRPARMSFSVSVDGGSFEWAGDSAKRLNGFFAQRSNLVSPRHYRMLGDIVRFNREAAKHLASGQLRGLSLGAFLDRGRYSQRFRDDYLLAMGAAIWSTSPSRMLGFPAESFVAFCDNHRLIHWTRPAWQTLVGGSRTYVEKLIAPFRDRIRLNSRVVGIRRSADAVEIVDSAGHRDRFDQVILATHSDQALSMLTDAQPDERAVLAAIPYAASQVFLHRDPALMPRRRAAWSAWNLAKPWRTSDTAAVTYWMNAIQGIDEARPLFVSLNPPKPPQDHLTFDRFVFEHPQYDQEALQAQQRLTGIQGVRRTWFCGAWTRYGFHEDGLVSGLSVAEALGAEIPWPVSERRLPLAAE
jgi:predicted NAD/FAD-binding protein